ncbi:MAG: TPM domain-containing protein [Candidatus Omnitrophota bacterium]|nr:MAG: TPM domain-containing protein [Candidatus Omnitrophota bacterium]
MIKKLILISTLLIITANFAYAQEEAGMPAYRGYVNDFANVISAEDERTIEALAQELETETTAQIAVVTMPTTKPSTIEQYAVELFEKWGIGTKEKDNGVLILMAANDKKVRIETGYGLEGAIPDAIANQIISRIMIPQFKQGNFSKGIVLGAVSVAQLAAKEYNVKLTGAAGYARAATVTPASPAATLLRLLMTLSFFILIFGLRSGLLFYFILGGMGRRRGGMWYGTGYHGTGGGFSGGFGGFGGGLSGGGGASGGW